MDAYRLFKFLHLAAVALWVGGAFSFSLLLSVVGAMALKPSF
jgi:putative copper export protein